MTDKQLLESINQIVASQLEPIKATLHEHSTILGEHTQILREHTQILGEHTQILGEHTQILGEHSKDLKSLKGKVNRIDKTLNIVITNFDRRIVENTRDIEQIKSHLALSSKQ